MDEKYYSQMQDFLKQKNVNIKIANNTKEIKNAKNAMGIFKPSKPIIIK